MYKIYIIVNSVIVSLFHYHAKCQKNNYKKILSGFPQKCVDGFWVKIFPIATLV